MCVLPAVAEASHFASTGACSGASFHLDVR